MKQKTLSRSVEFYADANVHYRRLGQASRKSDRFGNRRPGLWSLPPAVCPSASHLTSLCVAVSWFKWYHHRIGFLISQGCLGSQGCFAGTNILQGINLMKGIYKLCRSFIEHYKIQLFFIISQLWPFNLCCWLVRSCVFRINLTTP